MSNIRSTIWIHCWILPLGAPVAHFWNPTGSFLALGCRQEQKIGPSSPLSFVSRLLTAAVHDVRISQATASPQQPGASELNRALNGFSTYPELIYEIRWRRSSILGAETASPFKKTMRKCEGAWHHLCPVSVWRAAAVSTPNPPEFGDFWPRIKQVRFKRPLGT